MSFRPEKLWMNRGEVWWVNFDPSVGEEIIKIRPAVVVSNDESNAIFRRLQVVPFTTSLDRTYPGDVYLTFNGVRQKAMANQITTVSNLRFRNRMGVLPTEDMHLIEEAIILQLDLSHYLTNTE